MLTKTETHDKETMGTLMITTDYLWSVNSGRLGVKVDRVYSSGSTNYHYWSSFESKMTPIGSGKTLAEVKRYYWTDILFK